MRNDVVALRSTPSAASVAGGAGATCKVGSLVRPSGRNRSVRPQADANADEGAPLRTNAWRTWLALSSATAHTNKAQHSPTSPEPGARTSGAARAASENPGHDPRRAQPHSSDAHSHHSQARAESQDRKAS